MTKFGLDVSDEPSSLVTNTNSNNPWQHHEEDIKEIFAGTGKQGNSEDSGLSMSFEDGSDESMEDFDVTSILLRQGTRDKKISPQQRSTSPTKTQPSAHQPSYSNTSTSVDEFTKLKEMMNRFHDESDDDDKLKFFDAASTQQDTEPTPTNIALESFVHNKESDEGLPNSSYTEHLGKLESLIDKPKEMPPDLKTGAKQEGYEGALKDMEQSLSVQNGVETPKKDILSATATPEQDQISAGSMDGNEKHKQGNPRKIQLDSFDGLAEDTKAAQTNISKPENTENVLKGKANGTVFESAFKDQTDEPATINEDLEAVNTKNFNSGESTAPLEIGGGATESRALSVDKDEAPISLIDESQNDDFQSIFDNTSAFPSTEKKRPLQLDQDGPVKQPKLPSTNSVVIDLTLDEDEGNNNIALGAFSTNSINKPPKTIAPVVTAVDDESDDDIIFTGERQLEQPRINNGFQPNGSRVYHQGVVPYGAAQQQQQHQQRHFSSNYNQPVPLPPGILHGNLANQNYVPLQPMPGLFTPQVQQQSFVAASRPPQIPNVYKAMKDIGEKLIRLTAESASKLAKLHQLNRVQRKNTVEFRELSAIGHSGDPSTNARIVNRIQDNRRRQGETQKEIEQVAKEIKTLEARKETFRRVENQIRANPQLAKEIFASLEVKDLLTNAQPLQPNVLQTFQSSYGYVHSQGDSAKAEQGYVNSGAGDIDIDNIARLIDNIQPDDDKEDEDLISTPPEMTVSLLKHQRLGLEWLLKMERSSSKGGILADDMGLGKTVQSLALLLAHKSLDPARKTTLIVGPVALLRQWQAEISNKIKPDCRLKTFVFHSLDKVQNFKKLSKYDVVLTSYGTLASEYKKNYKELMDDLGTGLPEYGSGGRYYESPFYSKHAVFHRVILDEAHIIKNRLTLASKATAQLRAQYRLCLTGTPMQNNIEELYSLIRFLQIKPYKDLGLFRNMIALPLKSKSNKYDDCDTKVAMNKLQALLKAILLRRTKTHKIDGKPILQLTPRLVERNEIVMGGDEDDFYQVLAKDVEKKARKLLQSEKIGNYSSALTLLLRLRQACCHSFLVRIGDRLKQIAEGEVSEDQLEFAEEDGNSEQNKEVVKFMLERAQLFTPEAVKHINEEIERGDATCPLCFDGLNSTNATLLYPCGHPICTECIGPFFENFTTDEGNSAKCPLCSKVVTRKDIVNYVIFNQVCNLKTGVEDIKELYGIGSANDGGDSFSDDQAASHLSNSDFVELKKFYPHLQPGSKLTVKQKILREFLAAENNHFQSSPKMEKCVEIINKVNAKDPEDKIIIFSQFTLFFDLFSRVLVDQGVEYLRYDGSMSMDERDAVVTEFFSTTRKRVMLISLKAGNVGLTLTCASHVIIVDPFWNPYVEEQAMDRAHRIGQLKTVYVHKLLTKSTVEDRILELQEKKRQLVEGALNENEFKKILRLGREELQYLFGISSRAR